jgi:hypothetical protein
VSDNPYQAPAVQDVVAPAAPLTGAEEIRTLHLKHEASIKGVGFLFFLSGVVVALSIAGLVTMSWRTSSMTGYPMGGREWILMVMLAGVGTAQLISGWGLRKLRPWAKIPAAVLAGLSLLSIPVGTLIGGYTLYLLFSAKGRMVLSPGYAEIVAQTPHLRYRTPRWIWVLVVVLVLLLVLFLLFVGATPAPSMKVSRPVPQQVE